MTAIDLVEPLAISAAAPHTGASYIASLRDDRAVFLNGERITDVTTHPAFRNTVRSIARLYDALHDPADEGALTCTTDTGSASRTHRFFRVARSAADLVAQQRAIQCWAQRTYGWMGRTPDYKASLTNTFGAVPDFYGPFADNARRWHRIAQERVPFISHALANPPIDRHRPPHELKDVLVHSRRETDPGIVVSGAKVVATGAAVTNLCFVGHTPATVSDDPELALAFLVPIATPGVKLICRASYELAATRAGSDERPSPFDYPLSSRFDENDAILVLDNVLIPWDNVLIHRDPERTKRFYHQTGFLNAFLFHGCNRLAVKLDFLSGLLAKALRATGGLDARSKRALLGEVIARRHTIHALADAMARDPQPWPGADRDAVLPQKQAALAYCVLAPDCYARVREIIQQTLASGLIYLPSSAADLATPELDPVLARYVRGSEGVSHRDRIKLMKLLWDAIGSEFGSRHELYERNYAGGWECIRLLVAGDAEHAGRLKAMESLVDRCLSDYDEDGWTNPTWLNPAQRSTARTGANS